MGFFLKSFEKKYWISCLMSLLNFVNEEGCEWWWTKKHSNERWLKRQTAWHSLHSFSSAKLKKKEWGIKNIKNKIISRDLIATNISVMHEMNHFDIRIDVCTKYFTKQYILICSCLYENRTAINQKSLKFS